MFYLTEIGMESDYKKELPTLTLTMTPFWDGAKQGKLMVYKCSNCGTSYWPAINCMTCDKPQMEWVEATGKGELYTYTIVHQVNYPGWKDEVPYNVSWIKLDEGPILISNIISCKNEDLYVGMRVKATFDEVTPDITLPKFKPLK
jgi:uncharacterized protein